MLTDWSRARVVARQSGSGAATMSSILAQRPGLEWSPSPNNGVLCHRISSLAAIRNEGTIEQETGPDLAYYFGPSTPARTDDFPFAGLALLGTRASHRAPTGTEEP
jgi:hypothetical protein